MRFFPFMEAVVVVGVVISLVVMVVERTEDFEMVDARLVRLLSRVIPLLFPLLLLLVELRQRSFVTDRLMELRGSLTKDDRESPLLAAGQYGKGCAAE